jgi:homoserine dehydrogenase
MGKCEKLKKIYGICNATSNFILDEMQRSGARCRTALEKAMERGFTENDPEEDVGGMDTLYKTVIMAGFGMGHWMDCRKIRPISIKTITKKDIQDAKRKNHIVKPLFSIENTDDGISCFVGPKSVPLDSPLAAIKGSENIIILCGSESGERAFTGQGAGAKPTASAMFDDLFRTIRELTMKDCI